MHNFRHFFFIVFFEQSKYNIRNMTLRTGHVLPMSSDTDVLLHAIFYTFDSENGYFGRYSEDHAHYSRTDRIKNLAILETHQGFILHFYVCLQSKSISLSISKILSRLLTLHLSFNYRIVGSHPFRH